MKILVLENVDHLDEPIRKYLQKEHNSDDVKILYRIEDEQNQTQVIAELSECEMLLIQSTLDNATQFNTILDLIPKFPNIKEVRILYTYSDPYFHNAFLKKLNVGVEKKFLSKVKDLLTTIKLTEVIYTLVDVQEEGKERKYFKKIDIAYDIVPLYWNDRYELIWHERVPFLMDLDIYKHKPYISISLNEEELIDFKSMISEFKHLLIYQKDNAEELQDNNIVQEKKRWLTLLDKIKSFILSL